MFEITSNHSFYQMIFKAKIINMFSQQAIKYLKLDIIDLGLIWLVH